MDDRISAEPQAQRRTEDLVADTLADLRAVLNSIGETLYTWDIASDALNWGGNAAAVLRVEDPSTLASGRGYARLVEPDSGLSRYDAVFQPGQSDTGHGAPFQTTYALRRPNAESLWLQDTGRWFCGRDGRPARVHGVVRVVAAPAAAPAGPQAPDGLTGALTRAQLADLLDHEIADARARQRAFAVMLVGVEGLAEINDAYGLDAADELIAGVAQRLRTIMRRGDCMARYTGAKLAIVLMGCMEEQLPLAAQRFIACVKHAPVPTSAGPLKAAVRIGGVMLPRFGQAAAQAMQHAEEALSDAKRSPTRSFVAFAPDRRKDARRQSNRRFTDEIVAALNERRVAMALQPIVAAGTRHVAHHEALVRIVGRDGALIPASQVVPAAEKLGLAPLIDHRMLEMALAELQASPLAQIAINVSPATMRQPEWLEALTGRLAPRPDLASRLIVELTETFAIDDVEGARKTLQAMHDLGLRVAIDDFGSGHTSFRHLRELQVDLIKIDGAFVQNLQRSTDDRFFVRTLVSLAQHLGVPTVAEWVQDEETARVLEEWGVAYLQGELFGPELQRCGDIVPPQAASGAGAR